MRFMHATFIHQKPTISDNELIFTNEMKKMPDLPPFSSWNACKVTFKMT